MTFLRAKDKSETLLPSLLGSGVSVIVLLNTEPSQPSTEAGTRCFVLTYGYTDVFFFIQNDLRFSFNGC